MTIACLLTLVCARAYPQTGNIVFADNEVRAACVAAWDSNGDGQLSYDEAAQVTDLGSVFNGNKKIKYFDELRFFTALQRVDDEAFSSCTALRSVTLPPNVTVLGDKAFGYCTRLAAVSLNDGLTSIGASAFVACDSLVTLSLPSTVNAVGANAFYLCRKLESMDIPVGITSIKNGTFHGCSSLSKLNLPYTLRSLASGALSGCTALEHVSMPMVIDVGLLPRYIDDLHLTYYADDEYKAVSSPNRMDFGSADGLTAFVVTGFGDRCVALEEVCDVAANKGLIVHGTKGTLYEVRLGTAGTMYPGQQTARTNAPAYRYTPADDDTLVYKDGMKGYTGPDMLVAVGASTTVPAQDGEKRNFIFTKVNGHYGFAALSEPATLRAGQSYLQVPVEDVVGVGSLSVPFDMGAANDNIFFADNEVKAVCVANWDTDGDGELSFDEAAAVKSLGTAFGGNKKIRQFKELVYFTSLASVADDAFADCTKLWIVRLPQPVKTIGERAFSGCYLLTDIVFNQTVEKIETNAFRSCTALKDVALPGSLRELGSNAFNYCKALEEILIPEGVATIGTLAFNNCSSLRTVSLPMTLTSLAAQVFKGCKALERVDMPATIDAALIPGTVGQVGLKVSISSDYMSFCCPNNLDLSMTDGLTAYLADGPRNGRIYLTQVDSVPANAGMVLHGTAGNTYVVARGNDVTATNNILVGTLQDVVLEPQEGGKTFMTVGMSGGKAVFNAVTKKTTVMANRAYLELTNEQAGNAGTLQTTLVNIGFIYFEDAQAEALCLQNWDVDGDGRLSYDEAEAVTTLGHVFTGNQKIKSFGELEFFKGLAEISDSAFYGCRYLTRVVLPQSVKALQSDAFSGCHSLSAITLPDSLASLGDRAFYVCQRLTTMDLPESATNLGGRIFAQCTRLTDVHLPSGIKAIPANMFNNCTALDSIYLPEGVRTIGQGAFTKCTSLRVVKMPSHLSTDRFPVTVGTFMYYHKLADDWSTFSCPNDIDLALTQDVKAYLVPDCTNGVARLVSVGNVPAMTGMVLHGKAGTEVVFTSCVADTLDNLLQYVEDSRMVEAETRGMAHLTLQRGEAGMGFYFMTDSVLMPDQSAYLAIPKHLTGDCKIIRLLVDDIIMFGDDNVKSICIDNWDLDGDGELSTDEAAQVTDIGMAFSGNTEIEYFDELRFFKGLTDLPPMAFEHCMALRSIVVPGNVDMIGDRAFLSASSLSDVVLEEGVASVGDWSFYDCMSLRHVTLPSSVSFIGEMAFYGCMSLQSLEIPEGVVMLYDNTFALCSALERLYIPETMKYVGEMAFDGCYALREVTQPAALSLTLPSSVATRHFLYTMSQEYETFCSEYDLDFTAAGGIQAFCTPYLMQDALKMTLCDYVPAGEGVVLHGVPGKQYVMDEGYADDFENLFTGVLSPITLTPYQFGRALYRLDNGDRGYGFYRVQGSVMLDANRAYLAVDPSYADGRDYLPMHMLPGIDDPVVYTHHNNNGTIDDLDDIITHGDKSEAWYRLDGTRLGGRPANKGMYILNGKKVIVR